MEKEMENPTYQLVEEPTDEPVAEPVEELTEETIPESPEAPLALLPQEPPEDLLENPFEELTEEPHSPPGRQTGKVYQNILIGAIILFYTVIAIYLGGVLYYTNHFYSGTEINGIHVGHKTAADVNSSMASALQSYTLTLKERDGKTEQIKAEEADVKYDTYEVIGEIKKFKDGQNPFGWIFASFARKNAKMSIDFSYDEKLLKERIDKLSCFDTSNITDPENPRFQYANSRYVIVEGVPGNKADKDVLYDRIAESLINRKAVLDLETAGCYVRAQYDAQSPKIIQANEQLNRYASAKIAYTFGDRTEILDGAIINQWLTVDENYEISIDEQKVKDYINTLSSTYNTLGKTRDFTTASGETIQISGGDYGWSINKTEEIQSLIGNIKEGITVTREPIYKQTALSYSGNDIGNTYVEINIAQQHLWYYKNGTLITEGDVVSGNVRSKHSTPEGVYRLKYKSTNVILRGADYAVPVSYWMPFNGGIGLHDARWRSVFGKNIYMTNGSHGCINMPYNVAKAIYNNIEPDIPVICY